MPSIVGIRWAVVGNKIIFSRFQCSSFTIRIWTGLDTMVSVHSSCCPVPHRKEIHLKFCENSCFFVGFSCVTILMMQNDVSAGIESAEHMIDFVQRFLYPVTPLHNQHDLNRFIAKNNVSVVHICNCEIILSDNLSVPTFR